MPGLIEGFNVGFMNPSEWKCIKSIIDIAKLPMSLENGVLTEIPMYTLPALM